MSLDRIVREAAVGMGGREGSYGNRGDAQGEPHERDHDHPLKPARLERRTWRALGDHLLVKNSVRRHGETASDQSAACGWNRSASRPRTPPSTGVFCLASTGLRSLTYF